MPTATYDDSAFWTLNAGMTCIGLNLSVGDNHFDLHYFNDPNERADPTQRPPAIWCGQPANTDPRHQYCLLLDQGTRDTIRQLLCPITIHVPVLHARIGRLGSLAEFRLHDLGKESATLSWSAQYGGSVLLTIYFESEDTEILGTFHGQINNGRLFVFLALGVGPQGEVEATPFVTFSADINIEGVPDQLEPRQKIRNQVAEGARQALGSSAQALAVAVLSALEPDPPPEDAFLTQIAIGEGSATIAWADSLRYADVVVDSVEPSVGEEGEMLSLALSGGWSGGPTTTVLRFTPPNTPLALPLQLAGVALPDGRPLSVGIKMTARDLASHLPPREIGTILRSFTAPEYGAGAHTDTDRGLSAQYHIMVP